MAAQQNAIAATRRIATREELAAANVFLNQVIGFNRAFMGRASLREEVIGLTPQAPAVLANAVQNARKLDPRARLLVLAPHQHSLNELRSQLLHNGETVIDLAIANGHDRYRHAKARLEMLERTQTGITIMPSLSTKREILLVADYFPTVHAEHNDRFARMHTEKLAYSALELTGDIRVALACFAHHLKHEDVLRLSIPPESMPAGLNVAASEGFPNIFAEVASILRGYEAVRATIRNYGMSDIPDALLNLIGSEAQFLVRVLDDWDRLRRSKDMMLDLDANAVALRLRDFYSLLVNHLGYHALDMVICDTAMSVLEPRTYGLVKAYMYSRAARRGELKGRWEEAERPDKLVDDLGEGEAQTNLFRRQLERELKKVLAAHGFSGDVSIRLKSVYSTYRKLNKRDGGLEQNLSMMGNLVTDAIAARVVLSGDDNQIMSLGRLSHALRNDLRFRRYCVNSNSYENYVRHPKKSGYRSIHLLFDTAAFLDALKLDGEAHRRLSGFERMFPSFEVQLRTEDMHMVNEFGAANNAAYKARERGVSFNEEYSELVALANQRVEITRMFRVEITEVSPLGKRVADGAYISIPFQESSFHKSSFEEGLRRLIVTTFGTPQHKASVEGLEIQDGEYHRSIVNGDHIAVRMEVVRGSGSIIIVRKIGISSQVIKPDHEE